MSCSCGNKGCGDIKTVPGPQGTAGADGTNGADGQDGAVGPKGDTGSPGAGGGLQFERYINSNPNHTWQEVETVISGFTHTVGADGEYQVHVASNTKVSADGVAHELRLYINNVLEVSKVIVYTGLELLDVQKDFGILWRGSMVTGQDVELRCVKGGGAQVVTLTTNMLINKEA